MMMTRWQSPAKAAHTSQREVAGLAESADEVQLPKRPAGGGEHSFAIVRTRRVVKAVPTIALAAAAVLVACSAGPMSSGISGQTIVDGGCPVLSNTGPPCPEQPLAAQVTIKDPKGQTVAETTSNDQGEFRIELPPGEYTISTSNLSGAPLPYASPEEVTVRADNFTEVKVKFDSGVR